MHRTPSPTAAFWLAAFTYFIWGFTFLASRVAQNYGSPFVLLFWRFALAFVLMNLLCHSSDKIRHPLLIISQRPFVRA